MGLTSKLMNGLGAGIVALSLAGMPNNTDNNLENRVVAVEQAVTKKNTRDNKEKDDEYIEFGDVRVYMRDIEEDEKRRQKRQEEEKRLNIKDEYTFEEVTKVLGERYSKLSEDDKKKVKHYFERGNDIIKCGYTELAYLIYNDKLRERSIRAENPDDLIKFYNFRINNLGKKELDGYLEAFPWLKKADLKKLDEDLENPDKYLIYSCERVKIAIDEASKIAESIKLVQGNFAAINFIEYCINSSCKRAEGFKELLDNHTYTGFVSDFGTSFFLDGFQGVLGKGFEKGFETGVSNMLKLYKNKRKDKN